jgi:putative transposase
MGTLDSSSCLFVARHNYMCSGRMDGVEEDSYFMSSDFRKTPAKSPNPNQSGPKACHVIARAEGPGNPSHKPSPPCKGGTLMSQSLANIVVHLVFSTKGRRQLLRDEERGQLHAYITGILKNHDSPLIEINSVRDHIHVLFAQSKNHAPAKIVEQVKSSSSVWIKKQHPSYSDFAWQTGYGEFGVSQMHVEVAREYIRNQAEHHRQEDFQTEYRRLCEKNGKPLDDRYAWD